MGAVLEAFDHEWVKDGQFTLVEMPHLPVQVKRLMYYKATSVIFTLKMHTGYLQWYWLPFLCLKSICQLRGILPTIIKAQLGNVKVPILRDTYSICFNQGSSFELPVKIWLWIFRVLVPWKDILPRLPLTSTLCDIILGKATYIYMEENTCYLLSVFYILGEFLPDCL